MEGETCRRGETDVGKFLPRLRSEAVPGELQDLEAQSQEDGVFISYRTHENSQHHCLERKTRFQSKCNGRRRHWKTRDGNWRDLGLLRA